MKKVTLIIAISIAFMSSSNAQWTNLKLSKTITTEAMDVADFSKISASSDFKVFVTFSDTKREVKIEANENLHDYIKVENVDDELRLSTKSYSTNYKKGGAKEVLIAYVTTDRLESISGKGDAVITLENALMTGELDINLHSDAVLKGEVIAKKMNVNISSDAFMDIEGSTRSMYVDASSDSVIKGYDFTVDDLDIGLKGDSQAHLTVDNSIKVTARGDSQLIYKGDATINRERISGDSKVFHKR